MKTSPLLIPFLLLFAWSLPSQTLAGDGGTADEKKLKAGDRDPAFLQKVNETVRRGVEYILAEQDDIGSWGYSHAKDNYDSGSTAIALLALLKSGVNRFDPAVERGFKWLRGQPFTKTYSTAITIMAIEARWGKIKPADRISQEKTRAVFKKSKVPKADLDWMKEAVRFLLDNIEYSERRTVNGTLVTKPDAWSYPRNHGSDSSDHSNTQYALLGLKAASRCGIRMPKDPFVLVLKHFIKFQEKTGPRVMRVKMIEDRKHGYVSYKPVSRVMDTARGWTYSGGVQPQGDSGQHPTATTGSMTSVGVASIIICLSELGSRDINAATRSDAKKAVNDGLAWLNHRFTVTKNPGHPNGGWLYYYLYGLERAAVLAGVRNLGRHDWYREGAEFLIKRQSGKGAWTFRANCGLVPTTCLALLFLTKATVPVRVKLTGH
jgi:hypothetical protein